VIDVSGVNSVSGYPIVATATVSLDAFGTPNSVLNNIPVRIRIPAGAIIGNYNLVTGIWKFGDEFAPSKLITTSGPKTISIS